MNKNNEKQKKPGRFFRRLLIFLAVIVIAWVAVSLIGRIRTDSIMPDSPAFRLSIAHPIRLLDKILSHESLNEISAAPSLAPVLPVLKTVKESPLLKNRLLRMAARGNLEFALLQPEDQSGSLALAWDMGFLSPLLRILPAFFDFTSVPNLYYVKAGKNSRFEYRMEDRTLFIGPYRNVLFVTDGSALFESRAALVQANAGMEKTNRLIKPSAHDATMLLSPGFINNILAEQDKNAAAVLENIRLNSAVELGLTLSQKKLELRLTAPVLSGQPALNRLLEQRSPVPALVDFLPAAAQYATILSAGSLEELYNAALVFSGPTLDETLKRAESSSRAILGLTLDELLFSWPGKEFAVFGLEGRPHPVYAIQVADEKKRQQTFERAFKSIALTENVSLNLDGTRLPRIEIPAFLQALLRQWNLHLPSPYYTIYKGCLLVSESAETLLAALRAMQKNDVLPKSAEWRNIAGGKTAKSAFSLYYSLDLSVPFFLRNNTALSGFLGVYRQGLLCMSFDNGYADISLSLIPGYGGGISLVGGYPLDIGGNPSNQIFGSGTEANRRIFLTRANSAISINPIDNTIHELSGEGPLWVIPAAGLTDSNYAAWVVSGLGRVTLVNNKMEPVQGFPALTGIRLSSPPAAGEGRLYLCGEDEKVYTVDVNGNVSVWESAFSAAIRSSPSFLTIQSRQSKRSYAAVYPKSFFGEIWLLDPEGRALPNWPVPITGSSGQDDFGGSSGIGFGSPLLFAHNNRVHTAFVTQAGELFVFNESAVSVPPFPVMLDGVFYQQPVFDGEYLWLISSNGMLCQISLAGEILQHQIPGFLVKEEGYITVFDSNGDKVPEIFITGEGNALHGYNRHFRSLEGFPLPVWGMPLFVDPGSGGKKEIIGMGMDRRLYRWQFR